MPQFRTLAIRLGLGLGVLAAAACVDGSIGGGPDADLQGITCNGELGLTETPLRRLTHWEYVNTVRDLVGSAPSVALPNDTSATGFDNESSGLGVSPTLAEAYMRASEGIAASAVADMNSLLPCDPAGGEDACAREFIDAFVMRAFRRPLTPDESQRFEDLYVAGRTAYGFDKAIELVVQATLQSPSFLYRVEFSADGSGPVAELNGYEMAARLSYFLWGSMPDDQLFDAAATDGLRSSEQIEAQARRMLADPKARAVVRSFHEQWLGLGSLEAVNKDATLYPSFDDSVKASMREETARFVEHVVFDADGDLATLLTADYSFVDSNLAPFYGVNASGGFERVSLDPAQRAGLLTQPGVLAIHAKPAETSPTARGKFVRERLFCQLLPEPPPDVDTTPPEVDPSLTTRERLNQHMTDPTCASCHRRTDLIGFGFEHYDPVGAWRPDENGLTIDATGSIVDTADGDLAFDGAVELAQLLAETDQVQACVVEQWFTFAQGRAPETVDSCTVDDLVSTFVETGGDIQELLIAIVTTEAFRLRLVTTEAP